MNEFMRGFSIRICIWVFHLLSGQGEGLVVSLFTELFCSGIYRIGIGYGEMG